MLDICDIVFVDIQALIRVFDSVDGTVMLVDLRETGFYRLLTRIRFLKASADEAPYVDIEEVRKYCFLVVTNGKEGCTLYEKDKAQQITPFPTIQVDPTGADDSFLGGLVQGLGVPEAALLGNCFGSLTVGEIGLPKFDLKLLQSSIQKEEAKKKEVHIEDNVPAPSPRSNCSLAINPLKDSELILYGGEFYNGSKTFVYGDLYRYDVEKQEWKLISSPNSPPPRSAHQAVSWKNYLYVYGGEFTSPNQERFHHYKDFWMLDLKFIEKLLNW